MPGVCTRLPEDSSGILPSGVPDMRARTRGRLSGKPHPASRYRAQQIAKCGHRFRSIPRRWEGQRFVKSFRSKTRLRSGGKTGQIQQVAVSKGLHSKTVIGVVARMWAWKRRRAAGTSKDFGAYGHSDRDQFRKRSSSILPVSDAGPGAVTMAAVGRGCCAAPDLRNRSPADKSL